MHIALELTDDLFQQPDPQRIALEQLAVAGYSAGVFSHYQCSQLLGTDRFGVDALLARHGLVEYDESQSPEEYYREHKQKRLEGLFR